MEYRYHRFYIVHFGEMNNSYRRLRSNIFFGIEEGAEKISKSCPDALKVTHVTGQASVELRELYDEKDRLKNSQLK